MMVIQDEKNFVFNIRLAKLICLYQILDPGTLQFRGKIVYHIVFAFIVLYMTVISITLNVSGVYYFTNNTDISMENFWLAESSLFIIYKTWIVVNHSNDIWNCLSVTWYDFTSYGLKNRRILDKWRLRSVWSTTMLAVTYWMTAVIYLGSSLIFNNNIIPIKNNDGSISNYRQNIINWYVFVSDETFNAHYYAFYFVEAFFIINTAFLSVAFEFLLISLCLAICCQLEIVGSAFESTGQNSFQDHVNPFGEYDFRCVYDLNRILPINYYPVNYCFLLKISKYLFYENVYELIIHVILKAY